jgi:hypothetical protein
MLKRSLALGVISAMLVVVIPPAGAGNFSTGALLNSDWVCIHPDPKSSGPISDINVAQLKMAPTTVKVVGKMTEFTWTKFQLTIVRGTYTGVSIQVFKGHQNFSRKFLRIKNVNTEQRINFTAKVPTKDVSQSVLGITIQNPMDETSSGACIPQSVYEGMLPKEFPAPPMPETMTVTK